MSPVVLHRSSSGGVAIRYVLPILRYVYTLRTQWREYRYRSSRSVQRRAPANTAAAWYRLRPDLDGGGRQD